MPKLHVVLSLWIASSVLLGMGAGAEAGGCRGVAARTLEDFDRTGPYTVGERTLALVDTSRPTPANGTFAGAPSRSLPTEVWYPATQVGRDAPVDTAAGPYPVVVFSHGGLGSRLDASQVGPHLASRGMIVAAPEYPLTRLTAPGGPTPNDLRGQPGDWSFALDHVLAEFGQAADAERIGATGHSLGGLTTLLVTYHRDLRDPRVDAALAMAPPGCFFTRRFFRDVRTPLLVMHGDGDQLVDVRRDGRRAFERASPPRFFVQIENGSHLGFIPISSTLDPEVNHDQVTCAGVRSVFPSNDAVTFYSVLEEPAAGMRVTAKRCPRLCAETIPDTPSLSAARHQQLTRVTNAAYFEAYLLGDDAARCFLARMLKAEPDVRIRSAGAKKPSRLPPP